MDSSEYEEVPIPMVNRAVMIITPRQPYVDWANQLPDRTASEKLKPHTLESMSDEPSVYLIPEPPSDNNYAYPNKNWAELFEMQLEGWYLVPEHWPQNRTKKIFYEWFDVTVSSLVLDLGDEPLLQETD